MAGLLFAIGFVVGCSFVPAQPRHALHTQADEWEPPVRTATFEPGKGPIVSVDAGHGNWHTISGRFAPFAKLLAMDGYNLAESLGPVSAETLAKLDILVIANAVKSSDEATWVRPTPSTFTDDEVAVIAKWVEDGGSLLLIADHMPFPGSVAKLADAFGVEFIDGIAKRDFNKSGTLIFTRASGLLVDHPLTRGKLPVEKVSYVKAFTGQAFRLIGPADPILIMPSDWWVFLPQDAMVQLKPDTAKLSSRGMVQGAVLRRGKGRVAVFGEAGLFSAQLLLRDGEWSRMGMNDPEAFQNWQFVLNVMHWLSGQLD